MVSVARRINVYRRENKAVPISGDLANYRASTAKRFCRECRFRHIFGLCEPRHSSVAVAMRYRTLRAKVLVDGVGVRYEIRVEMIEIRVPVGHWWAHREVGHQVPHGIAIRMTYLERT